MQKVIVVTTMMFVSLCNYAYDFIVNGVAYNVISNNDLTCQVTCNFEDGQMAESSRYRGDIIIPSSVEYKGENYTVISVDDGAFERCINVKSITLPQAVTELGYGCFADCSGLIKVTLPDNITELPGDCFSGCKRLASIELPESIETLGEYCFEYCSSLTSMLIPENVKVIGRSCFRGCEKLGTVNIPKNVSRIEQKTFKDCLSLNYITLPPSLTSICESALEYKPCRLVELKCTSETPPLVWEEGIGTSINHSYFPDEIYNSVTLLVPKTAYNKYKAASEWNKFKKIQTFEVETTDDPDISGGKFVTLRVSTPNLGLMEYRYPYGYDAKFSIKPSTGWKLESVSFNGEDINADSEGFYSTGPLKESGVVYIILSQCDYSGIDNSVDYSPIKVAFCNSIIKISGRQDSLPVVVSDMQGRIIFNGYSDEVPINSRDCIICVKVGDKPFKLYVN